MLRPYPYAEKKKKFKVFSETNPYFKSLFQSRFPRKRQSQSLKKRVPI